MLTLSDNALAALRAKIDHSKLSKEQVALLHLWQQFAPANLPTPIPEFPFARAAYGRRWRFDVAWPEVRVALEFEGGVYGRARGKKCPVCGEIPSGRHTTGTGFVADLEKYNAARSLGWIVMQYAVPTFNRSPITVFKEIVAIVEARYHENLSWHDLTTALDRIQHLIEDSPWPRDKGLLVALSSAQVTSQAIAPVRDLASLETFGHNPLARRGRRRSRRKS